MNIALPCVKIIFLSFLTTRNNLETKMIARSNVLELEINIRCSLEFNKEPKFKRSIRDNNKLQSLRVNICKSKY